MTTLFASTALLPDEWAENVLIEIDKDGWIIGIDTYKTLPPDTDENDAVFIDAPLVPGMCNVHSHAFQRAMAGLTERAAGRKKTFWNWRDTMYRFLSSIEPKDIEVLAAQVFVEMLKAGYTSVGEFHYLHHQQDGTPYDDPAQLSRRVIKAALDTGIALTHIPVLYAYGGFGEVKAENEQKRFLNSVSSLMNIIEPLHSEYKNAPQITLGLGHHSLRAVSSDMLKEGTQAMHNLAPDAPIHILASSRAGEVEDCLQWSGKRPVSWLLESGLVDEKWCFIHATHVNEQELSALAYEGITVGLCPSSEANLGSGVFPLVAYFDAGGHFGIGSGNNASINMLEELRWLEYVQRLGYQERTLLHKQDLPSVGGALYDRTLIGGARALGRKTGRIEVGCRADFLVLDTNMPCMTGRYRDHVLDTAIFAAPSNPIRDVMSGGRWVIKNRRHRNEKRIATRYRNVVEKLNQK